MRIAHTSPIVGGRTHLRYKRGLAPSGQVLQRLQHELGGDIELLHDQVMNDSLIAKGVRLLAGHDVFISYARADATLYAQQLAAGLLERGIDAFLDQAAAPPDRQLPPLIRKALRRSTVLLIVGSKAALNAHGVVTEVEAFVSTSRVVILLAIGEVRTARWWPPISGLAPVDERPSALKDGVPSETVYRRIEAAIGYRRRARRLRQSVAVMVGLFVALAGLSWWLSTSVREATARLAQARDAIERAERRQTQLTRKNRALALANEGVRRFEHDPTTAIRLAQAAYDLAPSEVDTRRVLAQTFYGALDQRRSLHGEPTGPFGWLDVVAFSPMGDRAFVVAMDEQQDHPRALVITLPGGAPVRSFEPGLVRDARFWSDGQSILTCGSGTHLWDGRGSKRELSRNDCWSIATDAAAVLEGHTSGFAVYDAASGDKRLSIDTPGKVKRVAFLGGDRIVIVTKTATDGDVVQVRRRDTGKVVTEFPGDPYVLALETHPRQPLVIVGGDRVEAWSVEAKPKLLAATEKSSGDVVEIAVSRDGTRLVTGDRNGTVQELAWDGRQLRLMALMDRHVNPAHTHNLDAQSQDEIRAVSILADGDVLTAGARTVQRWVAGESALRVLRGHSCNELNYCGVQDIAFSRDGSFVVTAGQDRTLRVWSPSTGTHRTLASHRGEVDAVAISANGRWLLSGGGNVYQALGEAVLWARQDEDYRAVPLAGHDGEVFRVAMSGTRAPVLATAGGRQLLLWDAQTATCKGPPITRDGTHPRLVELSEDGTRLAVAWGDNTVELRDVATREVVRHWAAEASSHSIDALGLLRSGDVLWAEWSFRGSKVHRSSAAGDDTLVADLDIAVADIAVSPDGSTVALAHGRVVELLDMATMRSLATLRGHEGEVRAVTFSRDGRHVASASTDGTARLWLTPSGLSSWLADHGDVAALPKRLREEFALDEP